MLRMAALYGPICSSGGFCFLPTHSHELYPKQSVCKAVICAEWLQLP